MAILKSWSSKIHSTQTSAVLGIVSELIIIDIIMSSGFIVFVWAGFSARNFWHKSVDQSSLEDQDKQQIGFFVIRFTVEYSDRLVATTTLKVLGSVRLPEGGGGYSQKNWVGCAARFPKPLPYLWPKSAIILTLFMTWPKFETQFMTQPWHQNPVSDLHYN